MSYLGTDKIGKVFLGDTEITKSYLGTDLVFQRGGVSNRIPYIRVSAGDYIDTGITPDETTKIIVWARNFNPAGTAYTYLFGSRVANLDSMFGLNLPSKADTGKIRACFGDTNTDIDAGTWWLMSHYHKYELSADGFYVDDTLVSAVTPATFSNNFNIYLCNCNNSGSVVVASTSVSSPIDICACKIYKGGVLVRDFTAVRTPSIGLKDAVSDTVFTNAGSGSFTFGRFNPDAYTPLKSILTEGNSYFVTRETGSYSLQIIMRCVSMLDSATWSSPIGVYNSTKRCDFMFGNDSQRNGRLYGCLGTGSSSLIYAPNQSGYYDNKYLTLIKTNNSFKGYYNYDELGTGYTGTTDTSFDTRYYISIGARRNGPDGTFTNKFSGRFIYAKVGNHNYVPALVNNVAGMYDTYNDVFKSSETDTPFTAGTPINS